MVIKRVLMNFGEAKIHINNQLILITIKERQSSSKFTNKSINVFFIYHLGKQCVKIIEFISFPTVFTLSVNT
jgi:hypothetical protein